jgi:hypothetical protein
VLVALTLALASAKAISASLLRLIASVEFAVTCVSCSVVRIPASFRSFSAFNVSVSNALASFSLASASYRARIAAVYSVLAFVAAAVAAGAAVGAASIIGVASTAGTALAVFCCYHISLTRIAPSCPLL